MMQDEEHLRLLSIFHYVFGGITALFSFFPVFHLVIGLMFLLAPEQFAGKGEPPPELMGWLFVTIAGVFIITGLIFSVLVIIAGRFLAQHSHYTYCLVIACLECLCMPLGTVLGVFTIIVLVRDPVKQLFAANRPISM